MSRSAWRLMGLSTWPSSRAEQTSSRAATANQAAVTARPAIATDGAELRPPSTACRRGRKSLAQSGSVPWAPAAEAVVVRETAAVEAPGAGRPTPSAWRPPRWRSDQPWPPATPTSGASQRRGTPPTTPTTQRSAAKWSPGWRNSEEQSSSNQATLIPG